MMSCITDLSNTAFRHVFRFADARTLAAAECLMPRLAQVARAAVVELADARYGMTLEAVAGCAWKLLVQEGLAGPGGADFAADGASGIKTLETQAQGSLSLVKKRIAERKL